MPRAERLISYIQFPAQMLELLPPGAASCCAAPQHHQQLWDTEGLLCSLLRNDAAVPTRHSSGGIRGPRAC